LFDEHCLRERNKRKSSLPPLTNQAFNAVTSAFLGKSLLCQAVDIYNSYCQDVLQLAIANNPEKIPTALGSAKKFRDELKKAAKDQSFPATALLDLFRTTYIVDSSVRQAIHTHLEIGQFTEAELLCICRNIIVHKRGNDTKQEVRAKLAEIGSKRSVIGAPSFPLGHLPITLNANNRLIIDHKVGIWAAELLKNQIFAMDQSLSHFYRLPTAAMPRTSLGRIYVTDNM